MKWEKKGPKRWAVITLSNGIASIKASTDDSSSTDRNVLMIPICTRRPDRQETRRTAGSYYTQDSWQFTTHNGYMVLRQIPPKLMQVFITAFQDTTFNPYFMRLFLRNTKIHIFQKATIKLFTIFLNLNGNCRFSWLKILNGI